MFSRKCFVFYFIIRNFTNNKYWLLDDSCKGLAMQKVHEGDTARRLKQGRVVLRVIDFSDRKNRNIAKKYRVSWSSLFIVSHKNGKETVGNLTEFAFANARTTPEKFKAGVASAVNRALK